MSKEREDEERERRKEEYQAKAQASPSNAGKNGGSLLFSMSATMPRRYLCALEGIRERKSHVDTYLSYSPLYNNTTHFMTLPKRSFRSNRDTLLKIRLALLNFRSRASLYDDLFTPYHG